MDTYERPLTMKELGYLFDRFWDFHNIPNKVPHEDSLRIKNSRLWNTDPMTPFFIDPEEDPSTREVYKYLFIRRYGKMSLDKIYEELLKVRTLIAHDATDSFDTALISCLTVLRTPLEAIANTWTSFPHILSRNTPQFLEDLEKETSPSFVGKACLDCNYVNPALYLIEWRIENGI